MNDLHGRQFMDPSISEIRRVKSIKERMLHDYLRYDVHCTGPSTSMQHGTSKSRSPAGTEETSSPSRLQSRATVME